ncbi:hypothetical protein pipiens_005653 [Culex pipiens pipiens]|uniref:Odorant receptor n=1 Tax=Culex pipiens pipiens TaxID=38569 RepID=A0ABD1DVM8_CULPP
METVRWGTLPEELRAMPFTLRIMEFVGLWGSWANFYRFALLYSLGIMDIVFPKIFLGIGSDDVTAICKGVAELMFELSIYCTLAILAAKRKTFEQKIDLNLINVMIIFFLSLVHVFCYSYLGSELAEEAAAVGTAIYDLPWYEHSAELQRYYRLMIQRTQRPTGITGVKFFVVERTTFFSVRF